MSCRVSRAGRLSAATAICWTLIAACATSPDEAPDADAARCDVTLEALAGDTVSIGAYLWDGFLITEAYESIDREDGWDGLMVQLVNGQEGRVDLSGHRQYKTCRTCVLYCEGCVGDDNRTCARYFQGVRGEVAIDALDERAPWAGKLSARLQDLHLLQVTIDWQSQVSAPVHGGQTLCIGRWRVDGDVANWNEP